MKITKIENKDILKIKSLWEELNKHHLQNSTHFKKHFKAVTFEKRIKQFESKDAVGIFVAKEDDNIIGYCIASFKEQSGEIDSIFINPTHRNKKVGEQLFEKAESWLKGKGVQKLFVCVAEGNESAFSFYNKKGYFHRFTVFEKET